jgi:hypothetical protein
MDLASAAPYAIRLDAAMFRIGSKPPVFFVTLPPKPPLRRFISANPQPQGTRGYKAGGGYIKVLTYVVRQ